MERAHIVSWLKLTTWKTLSLGTQGNILTLTPLKRTAQTRLKKITETGRGVVREDLALVLVQKGGPFDVEEGHAELKGAQHEDQL